MADSPMNSDLNQLFADLRFFTERMGWFTAGRSEEGWLDTASARELLAIWDERLEPWRGHIADEQVEAHFESLVPWMEKVRANVRFMFLAALHDTVMARFRWIATEKTVAIPGRMLANIEASTPEDREMLLQQAREVLGHEFDAEAMFRDTMAMADRSEQDWLKQRALFDRLWAEHITPEIAGRLQSSDFASSALWMAEIVNDMAESQQQHPELK